jgi:acyl carrier protein phosphodiesterase
MENDLGYKEYPAETMTVAEWEQTLPDDAGEMQSSRDYYLSQVKRVSPKTVAVLSDRHAQSGITEEELAVI